MTKHSLGNIWVIICKLENHACCEKYPPQSSPFSLSYPLKKLSLLWTDSVHGQISTHIAKPNRGNCWYVPLNFVGLLETLVQHLKILWFLWSQPTQAIVSLTSNVQLSVVSLAFLPGGQNLFQEKFSIRKLSSRLSNQASKILIVATQTAHCLVPYKTHDSASFLSITAILQVYQPSLIAHETHLGIVFRI